MLVFLDALKNWLSQGPCQRISYKPAKRISWIIFLDILKAGACCGFNVTESSLISLIVPLKLVRQ